MPSSSRKSQRFSSVIMSAHKSALRGTPPERNIDALDAFLGFGQQPVAEVATDYARPFADFWVSPFSRLDIAARFETATGYDLSRLWGVGAKLSTRRLSLRREEPCMSSVRDSCLAVSYPSVA